MQCYYHVKCYQNQLNVPTVSNNIWSQKCNIDIICTHTRTHVSDYVTAGPPACPPPTMCMCRGVNDGVGPSQMITMRCKGAAMNCEMMSPWPFPPWVGGGGWPWTDPRLNKSPLLRLGR